MATNQCPTCGAALEPSAVVCPQCQKVVAGRKRTSLGVILIGCALIAVAVAIIIQKTREPQIETQPPVVELSAADLAALESQAKGGDREAQNRLGEILARDAEYAKAAEWFRLAAEQGHTGSQKQLAALYQVGQGVPRDSGKAIELYTRAAEQGDVAAQYSLAVMYASGDGTEMDDQQALVWYRRAAGNGEALAQYNLGQRALNGRGVPQDHVEAYKWLSLAAAQNQPDAEAALNGLKKSLTPEQIAEGKSRVASFSPTENK